MRVLLVILLFFPSLVPGAVWQTVYPFNAVDVQSNINNCANGDIVAMTNGITPGTILTNDWAVNITNKNGVIFQLIGPGAWQDVVDNEPTGTNTYTTNATALIIRCQNTTGNLLRFAYTSNGVYQPMISGFTIMGGSNAVADSGIALIYLTGVALNFRMHHVQFFAPLQQQMEIHGWFNGVIDHFIAWSPGYDFCIYQAENYGGSGNLYGDVSWADASSLGTTNALYFEAGIYTNTWNSNGLIDGLAGARCVVRHVSFQNGSVLSHDTVNSRLRGVRHMEVYYNHANWLTNGDNPGMYGEFCNARGGQWLTFSNVVKNYAVVNRYSNYRLQYCLWNPWGMANASNSWDNQSLTVLDSGTYNGTDGGTLMLTDTTKNWTVNQWYGGYVIHNVTKGYAFGTILTNDATHATYTGNGQNCSINTNFVWSTGDSWEIRAITNSLDQCGRGVGDLLGGDTPAVNTVLGGQTYPRQALTPCYTWSNTITWDPKAKQDWGPAYPYSVGSQTVNTNRDFYDDTIMPGYTSLVYPHPLVGGGGGGSSTAINWTRGIGSMGIGTR